MKTPHKHAAIIKAWADGAEIEFLHRIKPEPKPDVVETFFASSEFGRPRLAEHWERVNLKLTYDGWSGKLKAAEVL